MRRFTLTALAVAVVLAVAVARLASSSPDGLNRVAADKGFAASQHAHRGGLGYGAPLAALAGTLGVFALGSGLALARRRRP